MNQLRPKLQFKVLFILGILLLSYVYGFFMFKSYEDRRFKLLQSERLFEYEDVMENLLELRGSSFYYVIKRMQSPGNRMGDFIHDPYLSYARENLDFLIKNNDYDVLWVLDTGFFPVYSLNSIADTLIDDIPIPYDDRATLFNERYGDHFFHNTSKGLMEIRGTPINEVINSNRQLIGYFFLARIWDDSLVGDMNKLTSGQVTLYKFPLNQKLQLVSNKDVLSVKRALYDWNGDEIAHIEYVGTELANKEFNAFAINLFILYLFLSIIIFITISFLLVKWIYIPIKLISNSIKFNDTYPLEKIRDKNNEFGQLSQLTINFIKQKESLEKEIKKKVRTEKTLKISEEKFRELINQLPDYIVVHQEGKVVYVNEASCSKLGFVKEEVVNSPLMNFISKNDRMKVAEAIKMNLDGQELKDYDISIVDAYGISHPVIVRSSVITYEDNPAILSVLIDISERKKFEKELIESKAGLNAILDNLPYSAWLKDIHGRFVTVNKPFASFYDKKPEEIIGKTDFDLCNPEFAIQYEEQDQKVIESKKRMYYEWNNAEMTEGEWLETFKFPIFNEKGDVIGITGIARDITDIKTKQIDLIKAKEDADAANLAKQQFLSMMSHEVRNQLNAIIGLSQLLLDEAPKPEQFSHLTSLNFSAEHLLTLINDLLDFSKIEAGKIDFVESEFNFKELLTNLQNTFSMKASEKKILLDTKIDSKIPDLLIGDSLRLNQILTNLIGNAIKFTIKGKVTLSVKVVNEVLDNTKLVFTISDTGIGIPAAKQEAIFDPFMQTRQGANMGGTGLGLTITKRLIELQNGRIWVESEFGKGSEFAFELTYKVIANKAGRKKETVHRDTINDFKDVRILLVEDNHINKLIASRYLERWGACVDTADNGLLALERLKKDTYDIILMDLQMPEMDGFETTKAIRGNGNKAIKNIPIIALTASAMVEVRDQVIEIGMNDFITKPFNPVELNNIIAKYL